MSYNHILPYLLRGSLVQLGELGPPPTVLPRSYDVNVWCEFHLGASDHSIENYKALKYKVQDLIDCKSIMFTHNVPNVNNNLMPPHNKTMVNMVEFYNGRILLSHVDELKNPFTEIKNTLMKNDAFLVCSDDYERCQINLRQCQTFKSAIQILMDQGILDVDRPYIIEYVSTLEIPYNQVPPMLILYDLSQRTIFDNPITSMVMTVPTPFPFNDTKAVPWIYDSTIYI